MSRATTIDLELIVIFGDDGTSAVRRHGDVHDHRAPRRFGGSPRRRRPRRRSEETDRRGRRGHGRANRPKRPKRPRKRRRPPRRLTAAVDVEVTVDPASGPAGENATITVTGAPNAPGHADDQRRRLHRRHHRRRRQLHVRDHLHRRRRRRDPGRGRSRSRAPTPAPGSATYTIDNPESACSVTAEDLVVDAVPRHRIARAPS